MLIVFRVDSGNVIGAGHLIRCLNLANEIRRYLIGKGISKEIGERIGMDDIQIVFLCRPYDGNCTHLIPIDMKLLMMSPPIIDVLKGILHTWIGKSIEEDVSECIELIGQGTFIDLLVVDHYATDREWESLFKANCEIGKILAIEDDSHREHQVDFILNHAIPDDVFNLDRLRDQRENPRRVSSSDFTQKLMGPDYALINSCFFDMRSKMGPSNLVRKNGIHRIQISFGGSDPTHETLEVVRFFLQYNDFFENKYELDVILGFNISPADEEMIKMALLPLKNSRVFKGIDQNQMAHLLSIADICIGGGGVSMYERCCLGVPSIIISVANNQVVNTLQLKGLGVIHYLGASGSWIDDEMISALRIVSENLEKMSRQCLEILPDNSYSNICGILFRD